MKNRSFGMTLMELLVVITVFMVLIAITLPLGRNLMNKSRAIQSKANLRSMGSHLILYATENNNRLPRLIDWSDIPAGAWPFFLVQKLDLPPGSARTGLYLPDIFYCPQVKRHHPWGDYGANTEFIADNMTLRGTHGQNPPQGVSLLKVSNPGQKVVIMSAENSPNTTSHEGSWVMFGKEFISQGMGSSIPKPANRNAGFCNSLFLDGHVEGINVEKLDLNDRKRLFAYEP